jgi:trk system potassium uptake protein TrkH
VAEEPPPRHPRRLFTSSYILLFGFLLLILVGGLLLALPLANNEGGFTSPVTSFFTATSAVTVTGLTLVNTSTYWSGFGQAVIFILILVGGLGFMAVATFLLVLMGQRSTLPERLVMRDTMGADRMVGLRRISSYLFLVVFLIYAVGAATIFWRIGGLDGMGVGESVWQSVFLSVSSFNSAGFSILPELPIAGGLSRIGTEGTLLAIMMVLIVLGGIGWTVMVDIFRHRRFARFSLDTKLVIVTSLFLWALGAGVFLLVEFANDDTVGELVLGDKVISSVFHSVSGRTAGFTAVNFGEAEDFTKLVFPGLMFIGGAAGSVAGGIKVATFAVIIAAVISSVRGRSQAEAFGREIAQIQVLRALTVGVLGLGVFVVLLPILTVTEPDIPFLDLLFDTVSAFGTTGSSTGIVPDLSLTGKILFMLTMLVGRLGPLTLALALAPREEGMLYRYAQERVKIG